jgi:hypothetical protein
MLSNKPGTLVAPGGATPRRRTAGAGAPGRTNHMGAEEGVHGFALVPGDPATETEGREQYDRATRTRAHG